MLHIIHILCCNIRQTVEKDTLHPHLSLASCNHGVAAAASGGLDNFVTGIFRFGVCGSSGCVYSMANMEEYG